MLSVLQMHLKSLGLEQLPAALLQQVSAKRFLYV
jgi:hypothetical protein